MEAKESKLEDIFNNQREYEIPIYQRPYSWEEKQVDDLLNDLWDEFEENLEDIGNAEYFIGSIISIEREEGKFFEIVDGQQRLTTLNLLFATLIDLLNGTDAAKDIEGRIRPTDPYKDTKGRPRLIVREKDRGLFDKILQGEVKNLPEQCSDSQRRMIENYKFIKEFIDEKGRNEAAPNRLRDFAGYLLRNVYVVFVKTSNFDSAYRLFNVLNDRGLPLTNADLLKNKLFDLSRQNEDKTFELEKIWSDLEEKIGVENLDTFLGHHRTSILGNKQKNTLFKEYEDYLKARNTSPVRFAEDLLESGTNYVNIITNSFENTSESRLVDSLKRVSHDEWIPPLLAFLNSDIDDLATSEFLSLLERITYQNWIRRLGRGKRITVYSNVITEINNSQSGSAIKSTICRFASNEEFLEFLSGDIYGSGFVRPVLLRLESELSDDSVEKKFTGLISIEHILPQTLKDKYWLERFTPERQNHLVNKLGNLTLLSGSKNSAAQNSSFEKKKQIYLERGKKVSFDLTKEICEKLDWNENDIKERHDRLIEMAKDIWLI